MAQPQTEQRSARRFRLDLPVAVTFPTSDTPSIIARTRDVSSRGVFIYSDSGLQKGSALEFVMTLPPEITLADGFQWLAADRGNVFCAFAAGARRPGAAVFAERTGCEHGSRHARTASFHECRRGRGQLRIAGVCRHARDSRLSHPARRAWDLSFCSGSNEQGRYLHQTNAGKYFAAYRVGDFWHRNVSAQGR